MFRLTREQEVICAINGVIGLILCAGAIEVVGGVLTLQGTGSYEHFSPQARAGFSATYFLTALMCFGTAGSIYCNIHGTPRFLLFRSAIAIHEGNLLTPTAAQPNQPLN